MEPVDRRESPPPEPARRYLSKLAKLTGPIVGAALLQNAYPLVDAFWLGRLGGRSMAAVSIGAPIIALLVASGAGLAVAGSTFVSQYIGAGQAHRVAHVAAQTLIMALGAALVINVAGLLLSAPALHLLGAGPDIFVSALGFLRIALCGVVFIFAFAVSQSVLRSKGQVWWPLLIVAGSVALNGLLAPLLIFGAGAVPAQGVMGAAWATLISQAGAGAVSLALMTHCRLGVGLRLRDFRLDPAAIRRVFAVGLPACAEQSISQLNFVMMTGLVARFGAEALATYGIGIRMLIFAAVPGVGLSMATAVLVGQAIGGGAKDRAGKFARLSAGVGFGVMTAGSALIALSASLLGRLFAPNDVQLQTGTATYLHIAAFSYPFMAYNQALAGAYRGAGATRTALALILVQSWLIQLPTAFVLSTFTPLRLTGVWLSTPVANISSTLITTVIFLRGRWRDNRLDPSLQRVADAHKAVAVADDIGTAAAREA